nr:hypothetical protein [Tanacetum cinerariifolium]
MSFMAAYDGGVVAIASTRVEIDAENNQLTTLPNGEKAVYTYRADMLQINVNSKNNAFDVKWRSESSIAECKRISGHVLLKSLKGGSRIEFLLGFSEKGLILIDLLLQLSCCCRVHGTRATEMVF